MRYGLVALLCLYLGGSNLKKAFILAPFSQWEFINWSLFATGAVMLALVIPLVKSGIADLNKKKREDEERARREAEAKKKKYTLDNEEFPEEK